MSDFLPPCHVASQGNKSRNHPQNTCWLDLPRGKYSVFLHHGVLEMPLRCPAHRGATAAFSPSLLVCEHDEKFLSSHIPSHGWRDLAMIQGAKRRHGICISREQNYRHPQNSRRLDLTKAQRSVSSHPGILEMPCGRGVDLTLLLPLFPSPPVFGSHVDFLNSFIPSNGPVVVIFNG
jgi:hypothetical protein